MTTPQVDPVAQPVLDAVLLCLEQEIAKVPNPPAVTCMRPGDRVDLLIAQGRDECCEGLAWVRLVSVFPSNQFPTQDEGYVKCVLGWGVRMEIGVARCAPVGDENQLPSCDDWTAVVNDTTADGAALRRVPMRLRTLEDFRHRMYVLGGWESMTTEGGCVGGALLLTVQAPACDILED
jgi:hypothetical protein